uniref:Uncharacterized protein n=1 Tax=Phaeomonas parva TaxID=124430 RepID=A0A7S1TWJ6_9STRA
MLDTLVVLDAVQDVAHGEQHAAEAEERDGSKGIEEHVVRGDDEEALRAHAGEAEELVNSGGHSDGGGNQRQQRRRRLHSKGGQKVAQELLVIHNEVNEAKLISERERLLHLGEGDALLLKLRQEARLGSLREKLELTHALHHVVLARQERVVNAGLGLHELLVVHLPKDGRVGVLHL